MDTGVAGVVSQKANAGEDVIKMNWINNPCAYCKYHKRHMSVKMIKKKKCIERGCWHLQKRNHPFWENKSKK